MDGLHAAAQRIEGHRAASQPCPVPSKSNTQVLMSRDNNKWNYDVIMELLQGPLLNPKRLDEVIRATKFIRRIFSFLHPFNNRFSSILRTRVGAISTT